MGFTQPPAQQTPVPQQQQQQYRQELPNPELNWLAWLTHMTLLMQQPIQQWMMTSPTQFAQQQPQFQQPQQQLQSPPPAQFAQQQPQQQFQQAPPPAQFTQPPQQQQPQQQFQAPTHGSQVRVLGSPNNDQEIYTLQVGAFSSREAAARVVQQLHGNGFEAAIERAGTAYRVSAVGIPAFMVDHAVQRLGALGFREIWIR